MRNAISPNLIQNKRLFQLFSSLLLLMVVLTSSVAKARAITQEAAPSYRIRQSVEAQKQSIAVTPAVVTNASKPKAAKTVTKAKPVTKTIAKKTTVKPSALTAAKPAQVKAANSLGLPPAKVNNNTSTPALNNATPEKTVQAFVNMDKTSEARNPQSLLQALSITEEQAASIKPETLAELEKMAIALQFETHSISQELQDGQELMTKDVAMLWQAAVERSSAIRFALEKLSKDDGTGKPVQNNRMARRFAQSAARVAGVAGSMVTASPAGMIGGGMVEQMLLEDPTNSALQRVTDADMVILAKQVEELQSRVIELYYRYQQGQERVNLATDASQNLGKYYDEFGKLTSDPALETIVSSLYESAKQDEDQAKQAYVRARNELGLLVGPDAINALEAAHKQENKAAVSED